MKTAEILQIEGVKLITENADMERNITGVYIGDLLSLVMSKAKEGDIWITIQTHMNVVAVSELLDLAAVIIAEGMVMDEDALKKAESTGLPVFSTGMSAYEVVCALKEKDK